jgi:ribosomal protein S18 acetylase RimI-like enzyme
MRWSIVEFDKGLDRAGFDCGSAHLNDYIRKHVSQDLRRGLSRAYVAVESDSRRILGYYTLSSAQVACHEVPERWRKKAGVYPVPCSRIGRLAVDKLAQGKGLGEELLMHAYHTIEKAAIHIGIKAVIVDAENEAAEKFYLKYGFEFLQAKTPGQEKRTLFLALSRPR